MEYKNSGKASKLDGWNKKTSLAFFMKDMQGLNESFGYTMIDSQCIIIFYLKSSLALLSGFAVSILTGKRMFIL